MIYTYVITVCFPESTGFFLGSLHRKLTIKSRFVLSNVLFPRKRARCDALISVTLFPSEQKFFNYG